MEDIPLNDKIETWKVKSGELRYKCLVCQHKYSVVGVNCEKFKQHLSSPAHRIRVKRMDAMYCTACNLQFRYPSHYNTHLKTKGHALKTNPEVKLQFKCDACQLNFRSRAEHMRHIATDRHKNTINPPKSKSFCEVCDKDYKFVCNMKTHLATTKHAKNLAKMGSSVSVLSESATS